MRVSVSLGGHALPVMSKYSKHYPMTCARNFKRGWQCLFERDHTGPCGLVPRWWNQSRFARRYRNG